MEAPPPWLSPERTACAAAVVPWLMDWRRFMRCAHAGGDDDDEAVSLADALPIVPIVDEPPVAATALRAPPR
jgi:hypothetical protein